MLSDGLQKKDTEFDIFIEIYLYQNPTPIKNANVTLALTISLNDFIIEHFEEKNSSRFMNS